MLRHPHDAEDAVQDIFLEIWRHAGRFDPAQGSETTFVATIARRRLLDRLRRNQVRPPAMTLEDPGVLPSPAEAPAQLRDEVARARAAMQLRPEQREVLELSLGQGRSHQEIAAAVGIPLGTVKSHARRGLGACARCSASTPKAVEVRRDRPRAPRRDQLLVDGALSALDGPDHTAFEALPRDPAAAAEFVALERAAALVAIADCAAETTRASAATRREPLEARLCRDAMLFFAERAPRRAPSMPTRHEPAPPRPRWLARPWSCAAALSNT